jgi:hypothetical protein
VELIVGNAFGMDPVYHRLEKVVGQVRFYLMTLCQRHGFSLCRAIRWRVADCINFLPAAIAASSLDGKLVKEEKAAFT